jgi:DNA-directed RNA polymerase specialized sigma24 family protein
MGRGRGPVDMLDALLSKRESSLLAYSYAVCAGDGVQALGLLERALVSVLTRPPKEITVGEAEKLVRKAVTRIYLSADGRRRRREALRQLFRPHDLPAKAATSPPAPDTIEALRSLGPRERVCFLRYVLDDDTVEEIAHDLSLFPDRVRSCLRESLTTLEGRLGPLGSIDPDGVPILTRSGS